MADIRKGDIAMQVANKLGGTRGEGDRALNAVLDAIRDSLAGGNKVILTGFGSFDVREVKERKVRAIRGKNQGEMVSVPAHKRVGFKPGSELNEAAEG